jgi:hypothetical protein
VIATQSGVKIPPMHLVELFTLENHPPPYNLWPRRTRLFAHKDDTGQTVSGYVIEAQYRCAAGYLLITSYDCLFEEANTFTLLNDRFETVATKDLGAWYETFWLEKHTPTSENSLELDYGDGLVYSLTIVSDTQAQPKFKLLNLSRSGLEI